MGLQGRQPRHEDGLDISVIIATYQRAEPLRDTLEHMLALDREGLNVEWIVIDNRSRDHTREVVRSFEGRLPVRYLHETRPGKNCALNRALNEVALGRMVIFTDDDVQPGPQWLQEIHDSGRRWPEISVFGGRIEPVWPGGKPPAWVDDPFIAGVFYGRIHLSDRPCLFPGDRYPAGANFWVRRQVFDGGIRYNEQFGPGSESSQGASETTFLADLRNKGYDILYVPAARVGHCIQERQMSCEFLKYRAGRCGRTGPHLDGLSLLWCHRRWPKVWRALRWCSLARYAVKYAISCASPFPRHRVNGIVRDWWGLQNNLEQLRLSAREFNREHRRPISIAPMRPGPGGTPELDKVGP